MQSRQDAAMPVTSCSTAKTDIEVRREASIHGLIPEAVFEPTTVDELQDAVRTAMNNRINMVPIGGRTTVHTAHFLSDRPWVAISTGRFDARITVRPEDSLVTCGAGVRWADLLRAIDERGQALPFDPPFAELATVGGVTAQNAHGLLQCAAGTPRDSAVAMTAVIGTGACISTGARVVKNAAGYDICRLLAGSRGTLGIITEVTFRTRPRSRAARNLVFDIASIDLGLEAAAALTADGGDRTYLALGGDKSSTSIRLYTGLAGAAGHVDAEEDRLRRVLRSLGIEHGERIDFDDPGLGAVRKRLYGTICTTAVRVTLPPRDAVDVARSASVADEWIWLIPSGIIAAGVVDSDRDRLRPLAMVRSADHRITVLRCVRPYPAWLPETVTTSTRYQLYQRIRRAFDPCGVFSLIQPGGWP